MSHNRGRIFRTSMLCVLMFLTVVLALSPQAVAEGYYTYDTKTATWIWSTSTWKPSARTTLITISVKGLPPELSTTITVDGKQVGTIQGGGSRSFEVDKKSSHIFQVDAEVKGPCSSYEGKSVCTRYKCPNNSWTAELRTGEVCQTQMVCYCNWICTEAGCWCEYVCYPEQRCSTTKEFTETGHVFEYYAEHEVLVVDKHGQNVDSWYKQDSQDSFSAKEFVVTRDESNVKERDIFQDWVVNGVPTETRTLTLRVDKPYYVKAEYSTETQYRVRISSEFGNPTMDNPKGWYMKGDEATVSVEKEIPIEGWMGALGGKNVFVDWRSATGVASKSTTFTFEVEEPTSLQAEWKTDNSQPITILAVIVVIIIALLTIFALYRTGRIFKPKAEKVEQTELETTRAELEKARSDIEALKRELQEAKSRRKKTNNEQQA